MTVTVVIDDIPRPLNQNAATSMHWAKVRERAKTIRHMGFYAWRNARSPVLDHARVEVFLQFKDRRVRDVENWAPTWKHALDGMVKGPTERPPVPFRGVLPGDDSRFLTGPFPYLVGDTDRALRGCRLTFVFTPSA